MGVIFLPTLLRVCRMLLAVPGRNGKLQAKRDLYVDAYPGFGRQNICKGVMA